MIPLQSRRDCPNPLHDWPLPESYLGAHAAAEARLKAKWDNRKCPDCGLYGWVEGDHKPGTRPVQVKP